MVYVAVQPKQSLIDGSLAQRLERGPHKTKVAGSNPAGATSQEATPSSSFVNGSEKSVSGSEVCLAVTILTHKAFEAWRTIIQAGMLKSNAPDNILSGVSF
jgi:hypothetical protein